MGMYTEFHFNVELLKNTPDEVITILKYMLGEDTTLPTLPSHNFFNTPRWEVMLRMDSYYFAAETYSTMNFDDISKTYYLCIRCNLKNYYNEIEKFIEWIDQYVDAFDGDFLGFSRYEETEDPTLIRKGSHQNIYRISMEKVMSTVVINEQKEKIDQLERELTLARKLHWLAANDHIFFGSYNENIKDWDDGAHPAINCNDIFVPAADAEDLADEDVDAYLTLCKEFGQKAEAAWCAAKRNTKPWRGFEIDADALARAKQLLNLPTK